MARFLAVVRIVELLLGTCLALAVLTVANDNWGIVGIALYFIVINAPLALLGLWALIFRAPLRRVALWVTILPVAFLVIPMWIRSTMDGPISTDFLLGLCGIAVFAALGWACLRPRAVAELLPAGLFRSRPWNILMVLVPIAGWLPPIVTLAVTRPAFNDTASGQGSPGMGVAMVIIAASAYMIFVSLASLLTAIWAWLGLRGAIEGTLRRLHWSQLLVAMPGIAAGALILICLLAQN
ncbi:MAG TPA: hypothetical protein PKK10_02395 [Woeseiaceae bacterium]|nr:hypothetical protein [Woeseiaceae bacterium]